MNSFRQNKQSIRNTIWTFEAFEAIRQKWQEMWKNNSWILHDDNVPSHKAAMVTEFKVTIATNTIDQPPYSPDLTPCDFSCFPY